jgi:hypothetical protein
MSPVGPARGPYHHYVADVHPSEIRIGDTERESALSALGDHMSAGRLDIDEYGDRTARVAAAKTRGDLLALFSDLPTPHPKFGVAAAASAPTVATSALPVSTGNGMPLPQRLMAAAVPLASIAAVVLFFTLGTWLFFLLPAAVMVLGGAFWGDDWKHQRRAARNQYRQGRRDFRRRGRGW